MSEKTEKRYVAKQLDRKTFGVWDSVEKRYVVFRETMEKVKRIARLANED